MTVFFLINRSFYHLIVSLFPFIFVYSSKYLFSHYFFSVIVCDNKVYKSCIVVLFVLGYTSNIFYICFFSSYLLWNWLIVLLFICHILFLHTVVIFSISMTCSFMKLSCYHKLKLMILCWNVSFLSNNMLLVFEKV